MSTGTVSLGTESGRMVKRFGGNELFCTLSGEFLVDRLSGETAGFRLSGMLSGRSESVWSVSFPACRETILPAGRAARDAKM